jgi:uncharacterized membrane protein SirB2
MNLVISVHLFFLTISVLLFQIQVPLCCEPAIAVTLALAASLILAGG